MNMSYIELSLIVFLIFLSTFGVTFLLNHRKNQRKWEQELEYEGDEVLRGTLADLETAEKEVAQLDLAQELIKTHQLVESFNTMHGFDTNYIEELVRELGEKNIHATYLFKHTMPEGTMSYTGHAGYFELFVNKEAVAEAQQFIQDKLSMKN